MTTSTHTARALVVHPIIAGASARDPELRLIEARGLAEALDLDVCSAQHAGVREVSPAAFFGRGRVELLAEQAAEAGVDVVVIDAALTPVQQRNLERALDAKVLDRTGLILEIFGLRARTKEGRLQVELARLAYERSRLVRTWTHLERQRGGRGFLAGPGETQIEADRRVIGDKIARLRRDLEEVRRTRGLHRAQRKKIPFPLVALVGYTNAGKSSLFNRLTSADVLAKDMPFATLDPTLRSLELPSGANAMLSDTVGFISDLPHDLVAAFEATLEEVREADLLIHVRDIAHGESEAQKEDVETILEGLEAGEEVGQATLEVWNKVDLLADEDREIIDIRLRTRSPEEAPIIAASAVSGEGVETITAAIDAAVMAGARLWEVSLAPQDGRARAWLHEHGDVVSESTDETGVTTLRARLGAMAAGRFEREFKPLTPVER